MNKCKRINFTIPNIYGKKIQIDDRRYVVSAHKPREAENLINQLRYETPLTKLVTEGSLNPMVRALCFLSYDRLKDKNIHTIQLPIIPNFPSLKDKFREKLEDKISSIKEIAEVISSQIKMLIDIVRSGYQEAIFDIILDYSRKKNEITRKYRREKAQRAKIVERLDENAMSKIQSELKKHESELKQIWNTMEIRGVTVPEAIRILGIYKEFVGILNKYEDYCSIYKHLKDGSGINEITIKDIERLLLYMNNIGAFTEIITASTCLEEQCRCGITSYNLCHFRKNCPSCGGTILNIFYANVKNDVRSAWELGLIPEMIVAYMLYGKDWVKEIFLHKSLVQMVNGYSKSIKLDIIICTYNDKLVAVEVSTHYRMDDIFQELNRKIDNIKKSGVELDALIYVTSGIDVHEYFRARSDPFPSWILGIKHLKNLDKHIEYILREREHIL